jgi:hypothetical protein
MNHMQTFRQFLTEGGAAIKSSTRINQLNVAGTLEEIYKSVVVDLGLTQSDVRVLGSTGKKDPSKNGEPDGSSGDIDLAVSIPKVMKANNISSPDACFDFITNKVKHYTEVKPMKSINVISIAFPITNTDGKQEGKYVQLDIMPVDNLKYSEWAYHSPAFNVSKYKGAYRNELVYAIAKYMSFKSLKQQIDDSGEEVPVKWERMFYDLSKGLMRGVQSKEGKSGKMVKSAKTIEKELHSNDVDTVVTMLFGEGVKPKDVLTFEQALAAINAPTFPYASKRTDILKMATQGIINKGLEVPESLKKFE